MNQIEVTGAARGRAGGWRIPSAGRYTLPWVLAIFVLFVGAGLVHFWGAAGDDLASSYVGCRLVTTGETSHLYAFDPDDFPSVGEDDPWQEAADFGNFEDYLHPYVQTPLWAYSLRPVCQSSFANFKHLFEIGALLSFAACVWLVARFWAPSMWSPYAVAIALLGLWISEPFRYAMSLVQTHVLFVLLTLGALILAERKRPVWAGLLLALAVAVKITPGALVLYWLLTRRWRSALSAILWSAALFGLTLATSGRALMTTYLEDLHRISRVLLVAFNNQSVAAWVMGRWYPGEIGRFQILPLPDAIRIGSTALMIGLTVLGGWLDRRSAETGDGRPPLPMGAMIATVAATLCAPIAWTHYFIVLLLPMMLLWEQNRRSGQRWILAVMVAMMALDIQPLAMDMRLAAPGPHALVRSEFYAGVLCVVTLAVVGWMQKGQSPRNAAL